MGGNKYPLGFKTTQFCSL